jgi:tRNA(adenine34) deaminase
LAANTVGLLGMGRGTMNRQNDEQFMQEALRLAGEACKQEEVPVGAVLVYEGQVLAGDHNRREEWQDATAHAEILVLRRAGQLLNSWRLPGATLYVTLEPCPMCAGALIQARVSRLVFGCRDPKAGAVVSLYDLLGDRRLNHQVEFTEGILREECAEILRSFFRQRR